MELHGESMKRYLILGKSIRRMESMDKVTGRAKYIADFKSTEIL